MEIVHRDEAGRVTYLEREYRSGDTTLYHMAYMDESRLLKCFVQRSGDTLVEVQQCHQFGPLLEAGFEVLDPWEGNDLRSAGSHAQRVHSGEETVQFAEATLRDQWIYRSLAGSILDKRIVDGSGRTTNRQDFLYAEHSLVAWSYFDQDTVAYAVDSISWTADSTEMHVVNRWSDGGEGSHWRLRSAGDSTIFGSDGQEVIGHWAYERTPWNKRVREAALREGPACRSEIQRIKECLLERSIDSCGDQVLVDHEWDEHRRPVRSIVRRNGRSEQRVDYVYH
ncbi:MAG TPA: hypothetical protein VGE21_11595 [Flavobacteriales bacterium]